MVISFGRLVAMQVEQIVIAGGGVAAWLTAAALARRTRCAIAVVDLGGLDDSLGVPLTVEATLPSTPEMHRELGFDEAQLMRASRGCFALGRALSGWRSGAPAFHPYGEIGAALGPVAFHHLVHRLRSEGAPINLANYSMAALCAQSSRFSRPSGDPGSVLATLDHGLQLEVKGYRDWLKADAIAHGVNIAQGMHPALELGEDGLIEALVLDGGMRISGDLFIDCSGPAARLISRMPDTAFADWRHWLPCDIALVALASDDLPPLPYTVIEAHPAGWRATTSIQGGMGEVVLCARSEIDRLEAEPYSFTAGRQAAPWRGNCLAIGGAAAVFDPIASTQLHLAGKAILRLLALFPHDRNCRIEAREYNRQSGEELDNARDFAVLHYKTNGRLGEPFWDAARALEVPERLAHKIALYQNCARLALYDEESFEASDWIALFDAMAVQPAAYDAMADTIDPARLTDHLAQIRSVMLAEVRRLPSHADYLRNNGLQSERAPA
jgi:tryptophan 7-halogenase